MVSNPVSLPESQIIELRADLANDTYQGADQLGHSF